MSQQKTNCVECPLAQFKDKKSLPVYRGTAVIANTIHGEVPFAGNTQNPEILVVGESPSAFEILKKEPFSDVGGELAVREFKLNGFDTTKIFWANAARCPVLKKELTTKEVTAVFKCCRVAVARAILALKPKLVITYGKEATDSVINKKKQAISKARGKFVWSEEFSCWILPMYSPQYCQRDPKNFAAWKPDMQQAVEFIRNGCKFEQLGSDAEYKDVDSIRFLLDAKHDSTQMWALDTETQGNDPFDPNSIEISYSVTPEVGTGYNVQLAWEVETSEEADVVIRWPRKVEGSKQLVEQDVFIKKSARYEEQLQELLEICERDDIKLYMMNGNYDLQRLENLGIPRERVKGYVMDISSAIHALDPDNYKHMSLDRIQAALAPERVDHKAQASSAGMDKSDMLKSHREDPERHVQYAAADTDATLDCALRLRKRLGEDRKLMRYYAKCVHPINSEVLYDIEKNGIRFDLERLPQVKQEVAQIIRAKEQETLALIPDAVKEMPQHKDKLKLTRPDLIRDALFSKQGYGLEPLELTPAGQIGIGKHLLNRIREDLSDSDAHIREMIANYLEWGPYNKLYTTYLRGFENAVRADGKLHTRISKNFTATGRTGSRSPNLQNIPKRNPAIKRLIRQLIVPEEGTVLVAIDYSQAELRWIAQESRDPVFMQVYKDGADIHRRTGLMLAGLAGHQEPQITKEEMAIYRQNAKAANFGLTYGQRSQGFMTFARDNYGVQLTLREAEQFRTGFFNLYNGLPDWHERKKAEVRRYGYVRSLLGFVRQLPAIYSDDWGKRGEAEREALNTAIQSASNDATLFAALTARRRGICDDNKAKLVLFIHDELIYQVREDHVDTFVPQIIDCMQDMTPLEREFGITIDVPFVAEAEIGRSLADMQTY